MYALNVHQLRSVSGGQWSDTPYTGPGKLGQIEVGQTGMGSNGDYGGFNFIYDDGSTISFDGSGNVVHCTDSSGNSYTSGLSPDQATELLDIIDRCTTDVVSAVLCFLGSLRH